MFLRLILGRGSLGSAILGQTSTLRAWIEGREVLGAAHRTWKWTSVAYPVRVAGIHTTGTNTAARKGTRERKAKGKIKKEKRIRPFLLKLEEESRKVETDSRPFNKSHYPVPVDDVYFYRKYQYTLWDFKEALQNHREIHHPTVYNMPNSPLILRVDMDFRYPNRPNKCMDRWRSTVEMKAPFLLPGMEVPTILAIVPEDPTYFSQTVASGADMTGGIDIVKKIQQGEIRSNDYEYIVCHPLLVPELTPVRGLIKKNFPSFKLGTIDVDVPAVVKRLKGGIKVQVICNDNEPDYAYIQTPIGTLNMDTDGLQENFESILRDALPRRVAGKDPNDFIFQCILKTPHSFEEFHLNIKDAIRRNDIKKRSKPTDSSEAGGEQKEEAVVANV